MMYSAHTTQTPPEREREGGREEGREREREGGRERKEEREGGRKGEKGREREGGSEGGEREHNMCIQKSKH